MKSNSEHPQAIELVDEPERRMQARMDERFATLKQNAHALFRALKGYPRANDLEAWKKIYQVAKADYDSGSFLIEKLGARAADGGKRRAGVHRRRQAAFSR